MINPLPPDRRSYSSLFRTTQVLKVPVTLFIPPSSTYSNASSTRSNAYAPSPLPPSPRPTHYNLCTTCSTLGGNIQSASPPLLRHDGALSSGRTYLWPAHMLERNHWCQMCRLVWGTMVPFVRKLVGSGEGPMDAVMGVPRQSEDGAAGAGGKGQRWIELIAMVHKDTLDNRDQRGSGMVVSLIFFLFFSFWL